MNKKECFFYIKRVMISLAVTAGICVGLLIFTSCIPTSYIEKSVKDSSTYFFREELFKQLKPGYKATTCDNYADCIWINMIYELDTSNPFIAAIKAEYAYEENENVNITLKKAVSLKGEDQINKVNYSRYWHGSMVLIRPLLVLGDVQVVRGILAATALLLFGSNLLILYQKYSKSAAIYYFLSFLAIQGYVMCYCLNYIINFLIVNVMLLLIERKLIQKEEGFYCLMTAGGVVTCFCDFLTTETITLTLPIVIYLLLWQKEAEEGNMASVNPIKNAALSIFSWGIGYSSMFLLKWTLVYFFLGKEALVSSLQQATMRIQEGNTIKAICNNIAAMFRLNEYVFQRYGGILAILFVLFLVGVFLVAIRQKNLFLNAMILASIIPYLRYGIIRNHSQIHYFFTYRAQMTTLLVMFLCMESIWRQYKYSRRQLRKGS